ncbi:flocculation protein FLO11 [Denticeps clupeoides]|uniref:flocculation protein FLO11 n=1 Tax=Denticeps clupeoides TaxID=299321 RepID=UPI0010A3A23D|nr:flocculation protein FLO11-like [Denticeps clupeoides]
MLLPGFVFNTAALFLSLWSGTDVLALNSTRIVRTESGIEVSRPNTPVADLQTATSVPQTIHTDFSDSFSVPQTHFPFHIPATIPITTKTLPTTAEPTLTTPLETSPVATQTTPTTAKLPPSTASITKQATATPEETKPTAQATPIPAETVPTTQDTPTPTETSPTAQATPIPDVLTNRKTAAPEPDTTIQPAERSTEHDIYTSTELKAAGTTWKVLNSDWSMTTNPAHGQKPAWVWIIIAAVCSAATCVCIVAGILRFRKKKYNPASMNGRVQRSKKKKGDEDAWAGPVNLGGAEREECEGGEVAGGDKKENDGADVPLSTFANTAGEKVGPNGALGGEGTEQAQKWEEHSRLLYIDEDGEEEDKKEKQASKGENGREPTDIRAELNGAATFCLTSAV